MLTEYEIVIQDYRAYQLMNELLIMSNIEFSQTKPAHYTFSIEENILDNIINTLDDKNVKFVLKRIEPEKNMDSHYDDIFKK